MTSRRLPSLPRNKQCKGRSCSQAEPDPLRDGKAAQDHPPAGIAAEHLDPGTDDAIEQNIEPENLAVKTLFPPDGEKQQENGQVSGGMIELGGMKSRMKRSQCFGVRKGNSPWDIRGLSVAAAGGKTAESPQKVAQGNREPGYVCAFSGGEPLDADIQKSCSHSPDKTAIKNQPALPDHENLERMGHK